VRVGGALIVSSACLVSTTRGRGSPAGRRSSEGAESEISMVPPLWSKPGAISTLQKPALLDVCGALSKMAGAPRFVLRRLEDFSPSAAPHSTPWQFLGQVQLPVTHIPADCDGFIARHEVEIPDVGLRERVVALSVGALCAGGNTIRSADAVCDIKVVIRRENPIPSNYGSPPPSLILGGQRVDLDIAVGSDPRATESHWEYPATLTHPLHLGAAVFQKEGVEVDPHPLGGATAATVSWAGIYALESLRDNYNTVTGVVRHGESGHASLYDGEGRGILFQPNSFMRPHPRCAQITPFELEVRATPPPKDEDSSPSVELRYTQVSVAR